MELKNCCKIEPICYCFENYENYSVDCLLKGVKRCDYIVKNDIIIFIECKSKEKSKAKSQLEACYCTFKELTYNKKVIFAFIGKKDRYLSHGSPEKLRGRPLIEGDCERICKLLNKLISKIT